MSYLAEDVDKIIHSIADILLVVPMVKCKVTFMYDFESS